MAIVKKTNRFSSSDHSLVTQAVTAAEKTSDAEIITIVAEQSDTYSDMALFWASLAAFLTLATIALLPELFRALFDWFTGGWVYDYSVRDWLGIITIFVAIKWIGSWLILQWTPLRLVFTPRSVKSKRVRARAIDLFQVGGESRTKSKTAILLYLSMREHRADIVSDSAINDKVDSEVWGAAMQSMIEQARAGKPGEGMAQAVQQIGVVLAEHFPKSIDNPNELPDRLIEL